MFFPLAPLLGQLKERGCYNLGLTGHEHCIECDFLCRRVWPNAWFYEGLRITFTLIMPLHTICGSWRRLVRLQLRYRRFYYARFTNAFSVLGSQVSVAPA